MITLVVLLVLVVGGIAAYLHFKGKAVTASSVIDEVKKDVK